VSIIIINEYTQALTLEIFYQADGQKGGFGPFKAVDGQIRGSYGAHGEIALHSGWSWGNNLQQVCVVCRRFVLYSEGLCCMQCCACARVYK
jgi:hypothetical protein